MLNAVATNNWYDLILPGVSGLCWTVVYLLIIIVAKRTKIHAMPLWALAINISWELTYSIVGFIKWTNPRGNPIVVKAQAIMNLVWFLFDCVILVQYFLYAKKFWSEETKKWFIPWTLIAILTGFIINLAIYFEGFTTNIVQFSDKEAAIVSAFLDNIMMSICFVAFAFKTKELKGQSLWIGILKLIGTLAPTIFLGFMDFGLGNFVVMAIVPGFLCLVFDILYCVSLGINQKKYLGKIVNFKTFI